MLYIFQCRLFRPQIVFTSWFYIVVGGAFSLSYRESFPENSLPNHIPGGKESLPCQQCLNNYSWGDTVGKCNADHPQLICIKA
jgi:hypothetical protein